MRRSLSLVILVLAVGLVVGATPAHAPHQPPRPNLIFILTDDLDTMSLVHLPRLQALLSAQGTTFANFFVSLALCCPSRASLLRGQYAHNTQIFTNAPPGGGFQDFRALA
jgi:N-acetylglucosamine-6-sulfatase